MTETVVKRMLKKLKKKKKKNNIKIPYELTRLLRLIGWSHYNILHIYEFYMWSINLFTYMK